VESARRLSTTSAQRRVELLVDPQLAGVDDPHVHAGGDGVVEEHRVHRLAHRIVAAERERHVAHAAAHQRVRQLRLDAPRRLDEGETITVVLLDAGGNGEDVGIENDVLGCEAHPLGEDAVSPLTDGDAPLDAVGLALLIEGHDHRRCAVAAHRARVLDEALLAFLEADGVDDCLALHALQARLDDRPLGGVDHHRHARDVGLGRHQVEEAYHGGFRVQHALVHVDIDHLRTVGHLLARHLQRRAVVARLDELAELSRAGDVGAFADVDEQAVLVDVERFEARQAALRGQRRQAPRRVC